MHHGPRQPIRPRSDVDVACYLQGLEIDYCDVVVRRTGNKHARTIRLHQNASSTMSQWNSFQLLVRTRIEHDQVSVSYSLLEVQRCSVNRSKLLALGAGHAAPKAP